MGSMTAGNEWNLAGLLGSTSWGLWVAALGVTVLLRPVRPLSSSAVDVVDVPSRRMTTNLP